MTVVLDKIQPYNKERYRQELTLVIIQSYFTESMKFSSKEEYVKVLNDRVNAILESQK